MKNKDLQKLEFRIREVASQVLYKLDTNHRDPHFELNTVQYQVVSNIRFIVWNINND